MSGPRLRLGCDSAKTISFHVFPNDAGSRRREDDLTRGRRDTRHAIPMFHDMLIIGIDQVVTVLLPFRVEYCIKIPRELTYSTIEPAKPSNPPKMLGTTNTSYKSLILSLSNKEPAYVVLAANSKDISASF